MGKEKAEKENQKFVEVAKSVQERKRVPQALFRPLRRLTKEAEKPIGFGIMAGWDLWESRAEHYGRMVEVQRQCPSSDDIFYAEETLSGLEIPWLIFWLKCLNFVFRGHILKCHFYGKAARKTGKWDRHFTYVGIKGKGLATHPKVWAKSPHMEEMQTRWGQ